MAKPLAPSPFKFGYYYDEKRDRADKKEPMLYEGERHILLFGVNGAGKSTRILIENLVAMKDRSLVVFDMKGELAAQTMRTRKLLDDVKIINPYDVLNLGSDGFNPLAALDPDDDLFYDNVKALTLAVIEIDNDGQKFFPQTAQGWFCAGIMWEVKEARREGRRPSMLRARQWCLQPDQWQLEPDGKSEKLVAGAGINAQRMVKEGGETIAGLAARFARDDLHEAKGLQDVLTTLATETEFLISPPIARDLEKGNWSFAELKQTATCVYILLPPKEVEDKRRWTRLLITCALVDHLHPGPVRTLFILDEFRVSVGYLKIVNDFWALVRGYGVQFLPVCQSVLQLRALFKDEWENYAGQAGVVATIGPPGDIETAIWMSKRSGNTTIWQEGWSSGEGVGRGGMTSNLGENRTQSERAFLLPQELMSMKLGSGRLWTSGQGDTSIPFFAPNYWRRSEIKWRVDPNPYVKGGATAAHDVPETAQWFLGVMEWLTEHFSHVLLRIDPDAKAWSRWTKRTYLKLSKPPAEEPAPPLREKITEWIGNGVVAVLLLALVTGWLKGPLVFIFRIMHAWAAIHAPKLLPYFPLPPPSTHQ